MTKREDQKRIMSEFLEASVLRFIERIHREGHKKSIIGNNYDVLQIDIRVAHRGGFLDEKQKDSLNARVNSLYDSYSVNHRPYD
jgi:hypothetical protein